jgi:hypothetical protein
MGRIDRWRDGGTILIAAVTFQGEMDKLRSIGQLGAELRIIADFGHEAGDNRRIPDDHDFAGCYPASQLTAAL